MAAPPGLLCPAPEPYNLSSVFFTNVNTGYAVGDSGTILKTIDGAASWTELPFAEPYNLSSVYFTDNNTGFTAGRYYGDSTLKPGWVSIFKTANAGQTWQKQISKQMILLVLYV